MSNVVDMAEWLSSRSSQAQQYVEARGADLRVWMRSGMSGVPLSHVCDLDFRRVRHLLEMIGDHFGPMSPGAVVAVMYDDKQHVGHRVTVSRGYSNVYGLRWPSDVVELHGFDEMHFLEVEVADDD